MTDVIIMAIIAAIAPTIAAVATLYHSLQISKKVDVIHVLVNSRLETALKELTESRIKIQSHEKIAPNKIEE